MLLPGSGFRDIYRSTTAPLPGYNRNDRTDSFYYSAILAVTVSY